MSHTLVLNQDAQPLSLLPISTFVWENAIKAIYLDNVAVVHEYPAWEVHSPSQTWRVPSVVMTRDYVGKSRSVRFTNENVYLRDNYICAYCHNIFSPRDLTQDHVLPKSWGGRTVWSNITTACFPCNQGKGNDKRIVPKKLPRKPSYYELVEKAKAFTLTVPDASWVPYVGWPEDRLVVGKRLAWTLPRTKASVEPAFA